MNTSKTISILIYSLLYCLYKWFSPFLLKQGYGITKHVCPLSLHGEELQTHQRRTYPSAWSIGESNSHPSIRPLVGSCGSFSNGSSQTYALGNFKTGNINRNTDYRQIIASEFWLNYIFIVKLPLYVKMNSFIDFCHTIFYFLIKCHKRLVQVQNKVFNVFLSTYFVIHCVVLLIE